MDIGEQKRIIQVEPEPLETPVSDEPALPVPEKPIEPAPVEPVPVR